MRVEPARPSLRIFKPVGDHVTITRPDRTDRAQPAIGIAEQRGIDLQLLPAFLIGDEARRAVAIRRIDVIEP